MPRVCVVVFALFCSVVLLGMSKQSEAQGRTATLKVLYAFQGGSDGYEPLSGVINVNGTLYGTAYEGGASSCSSGCGTVFSLDLKTGKEQTVYSFLGGSDGWAPTGPLIALDGLLYGTTQYGGTSANCLSAGCGTVFSINPSTGAEKVLYSFQGGNDGEAPFAGLIAVGGVLYGTTAYGGGPTGAGTVFSVDPKSGQEAVVHAFQGEPIDGYYPIASLISVGGVLYGTTDGGGTYNDGTVFSLNPATGAENILHSFYGVRTDGFGPYAGLTYLGGLLYGTTYAGGVNHGGIAFSISPTSGAENVVYSFGKKDHGSEPESNLLAVGTKLYGATVEGGGPSGIATVFSLKPATGTEKLIYSNLPAMPSGLTEIKGTFFGTTSGGGDPSCGCGIVFALTP